MKQVVFSHGKEIGPLGYKIQAMMRVAEAKGYTTQSIDYRTCTNATERVDKLRAKLTHYESAQVVLVGSSMGGYVATAAAQTLEVKALFLLCPALYMPIAEYTLQDYAPKTQNIEIVHAWEDDVVPYTHSLRFCQKTKARLHFVNDGHALVDSLDFICDLFGLFLERLG